MFNRLVYGLSFLIFLSLIGHKAWKNTIVPPEVIVEAVNAHDYHLDGSGVVVAVMDEGFDATHGSLKERLSPYRYNTNNKNREISETVIFENGKYQLESHGTHVTGIITNLAPLVKVIPIKIGNMGGDQDFVKGLQIAASSPAHIVNISLQLSHTGREVSPNVRTALINLANAGKLIVIAAGNEGSPLLENAYTASLVELAQNSLMGGRLLLVGASSNKNGKESFAEFSNYPGNSVFGRGNPYFITAPGEEITSTITGGLFGKKSGTSMAAPVVVGVASLLKQAFPYLEGEAIAHLLLKSARKVSLDGKVLPRAQFGEGIVNLKSALEAENFLKTGEQYL